VSVDYDIAIVGAGVVGATLAAALANSGLRIALIEASEPQPYDADAPLDLRVFAISRASERILRALGTWDEIEQAPISAYRGMHVWEAYGAGGIEFDARDVAEPDLGHIVENRLLQWALLRRVGDAPDIETLWPRQCTGLAVAPECMTLKFGDADGLRARLVVAADGAKSRLRQWGGIETRTHAYQQRAVVSHLTTERPHGAIARQVFLADGVLALLPLADGRSSLIWSTGEAHAGNLLAMPEADFAEAVARASDFALGAVTQADRRASFPLVRMHAERYVRPRLALIGDAAHSVHPLAGQGVNLGMLDAAVLAETLKAAADSGRDVGALGILRRYERTRRAENAAMVYSLDGIQKMFSMRAAPVRQIAGSGLRFVDRCAPLKKVFIRCALGIDGELPTLAMFAKPPPG
jgi:2-octaprenylphenol hydroxylase